MESIVVYNNNVESLLQKAGFKVGFMSPVDDITTVTMVKLWYMGVSVIAVYYSDNVVHNIKHCNDNRSLSLCDTLFTKFFNELKEIVTSKPMFPPSLLNTFTNILFDEYDDNPVKLDKILMSVPRQDKEFIALFKTEIDQLTEANTSITTTPEQFQFYYEKTRREFNYVSEAYETTVLLRNLSYTTQSAKILDLRELSSNYVQVEMPTECLSVIVQAISAMGEVTNPYRVIEILAALGYKGLEAFNAVSVPHNIQFKSVPIVADSESISRSICFTEGTWVLSIGCDISAGYSSLSCDSVFGRNFVEFDSIKDIIRPCMFVKFATRFLSDLLSDANFALNKMPDVRTYCYQLLKAYDCIQAPSPDKIQYETTWDDVLGSGFDPVSYLEDKYQVDVSKLPTASVTNCNNSSDCDKLYNDLKYLLTLN